MKNKKYLLKIAAVSVLIIMIFGFVQEPIDQEVATNIGNYYITQMRKFEASISKLESIESTGVEEEELKDAFLKCRETYKLNEFILGYMDNPKYKNYNAANLVTSAYEVAVDEELKMPHGLQVMEELIYNPGEGTRETLQNEIQLLKELTNKEVIRLSKQTINNPAQFNTIILDALRVEVYRIEALGLTGFDVPNSLNGIPEALASLQSIKMILSFYQPLMVENNVSGLYSEGNTLITGAIKYLESNKDFDDLDRLYYYSEYLHPLSTWLNTVTKTLNYIYPSNVNAFDRDADYLFAKNSLNDKFFGTNASPESIALGKKLFNDKILSSDKTRSCATCHDPKLGFADGIAKNLSIDSTELLLRNTPSLVNVGYQARFFYDLRANTLERQSLEVIHNQLEMGGDLEAVMDTLLVIPEYISLFKNGVEGQVNTYKLYSAIADYVSSITGNNSKLDQYFEGDLSALNDSEKNGFNLFAGKAKCATCHFFPMFNGLVPPKFVETEAEILGVPASKEQQDIIDPDKGRMMATGLSIHEFAFKTPTLRNVELSAPYMHNGVFQTLEEVVEFYNNGGGAGQGMNLPSQSLSSDSLHLSDQEKIDLVNFMKALTDENFVY